MKIPRICIIGAGSLSSLRIYPYIAAAGGKLVGVCDLDLAKAEHNANLYGGQAYTDFEQMLNEQKPDAVIVCIGPTAHQTLAPKIMRLGYPVYTEKPPAANAANALAVARVAHELDQLCVTAFKKRYTHAAERAKAWIAEHEGSLLSLSIDYCSAPYRPNHPSGFLLDFTVHILDLTHYLFGDVREVFAFNKGTDAYAISLRFDNGAVGSLNLNDGRSFKVPTEEIEITAAGGNWMTIHNSSQWKIAKGGQPSEWREPSTFTSGGDSGRDTGHLAEIEDFFAAVREGRKTSRSQIYEGYKTMLLYDAIVESCQTGRVVKIEYEAVASTAV